MMPAAYFPAGGGAQVVRALAETIAVNSQKLSDLDGLIGDGDHGINMRKGFDNARNALGAEPHELAAAFIILANELAEIGGSMGPLYGSLFRAMARTAQGADRIDAGTFGAMLAAAEEIIISTGGCQRGDKTLLDVLGPAREAYSTAILQGKHFARALAAMTAAAETGREATVAMIARKGRASRLGERSRGVPDPGAASCCLLLCSLAESFQQELIT